MIGNERKNINKILPSYLALRITNIHVMRKICPRDSFPVTPIILFSFRDKSESGHLCCKYGRFTIFKALYPFEKEHYSQITKLSFEVINKFTSYSVAWGTKVN